MSESIARKVQPFTIGTRLSVPAVPKCQEFTQSYLQNQSLDNCSLQRNLNSLYLSRTQVCAHGPCLASPVVKRASPGKQKQEEPAAEDHLNQNVASPSAVSRSIKKITISGNKEPADSQGSAGPPELPVGGSVSENNNNNNNISRTSEAHLPRIVGVSCENKPSSQFKVLLQKDRFDEFQPPQGQTRMKLKGEKCLQQISVETDGDSHVAAEASAAAASRSDCFTQRNSLLHQEVLQAEAWIKSELRDGGDLQRCPLQDREEAPRSLRSHVQDSESTAFQLHQASEQLICKLKPVSDSVEKQLGQLREQGQTLKHTQSRTLDGATGLQDFNKKVERLEAWIKEKQEEEGSLANVLKENVDKMQLTRKILDLKQDEQLHRNLHEEINHLALKLEKREKTDGKNISSKRKHINKMWLKVQNHLKTYQEGLQQALEVSSFYQQADNTLSAITNMRKNPLASNELVHAGDREMRDIASQIMMLDVSVSQLSNLHPALAATITQKQRELKDGWSRLQRDFRSDRAALSPTSSAFTRETADPLTQAPEPQFKVGTETQRIMGKGVREEHRLDGCASAVECGLGRQLPGNQRQRQQSANHTSSPVGDGAACADDVIARLQQKAERKPKLATVSLSHPQLQKFTVSADKTLSWLKDNVSIATQVCSIANCEGLEVARRCQYALEQEILNNKARIEVVKREGHELVRARHPGSAKIQEFLVQLGGLWEELRRRHQRNAVFLEASEELALRVVKVLRDLGGLEAWLESAQLSLKGGDPETASGAERDTRPLEAEAAARLVELRVLRQEVDDLHGHGHPHHQSLQARLDRLEQKYQGVQRNLTQQQSELQDARTLTEFLERVELEESQEQRLVQPLQSETSSSSSSLGLRSRGDEALTENPGTPAETLQETLSHPEREKSHFQEHEETVEAFLSRHAGLALRVEESLCRGNELSLDILEKETDMAVRCEPDHCGLDVLQEKQDHQEITYESIREEIKETERQAARLERTPVLEGKLRVLLQGWAELGDTVVQNKLRLQEFVQLQDFFRSYLAMISWTEDTRSCIFSDTALHLGKDGRKPLAAELDMQIEQKFKEFEELVTTGKKLLDKDHHLTQMVRERMEELRSMLGWITVHWRAQKQQWLHKKSREEATQDNIYSTMCLVTKTPAPEIEAFPSQQPSLLSPDDNKSNTAGNSWPSRLPPKPAGQREEKPSEDGYEVMKSIGPPNPTVTLVKDAGSPASGGTVNLILSLSNPGDGLVQVLEQPPQAGGSVDESAEPIHRVSTYFHVKDSNLSAGPVYESITLPRQKSHSSSSGSPTFFAPPSASPPSSGGPGLQAANISFHPLAGSGSSSIFSSLKRMGKKRKRKRDARRHTIQKIMGVEEQPDTCPSASEAVSYDTHTWPLKEDRRRKSSAVGGGAGGVEAMAYMKNPLLTDIDKDCSGDYSITPYAVSEATTLSSTNEVRSHCRFLSLGSVLSFDLPKDMTLIPSIQDIITIAPPESKTATGTDPDPLSQRHTALSSFRQSRPAPAATCINSASNTVVVKGSPDGKKRVQPLDNGEEQTVPCNDLSETQYGPHEDVEQEWDKMSAEVASRADGKRQCSPQPIYVNQLQSAAEHKHKCPSVHTRIRDLNGHRYHKNGHECQSQASHVVVNLKSTVSVNVRQDSVDSGISTSSSLKLCPDAPEAPQPKGVVGRLMSLEVGGIDCSKKRDSPVKSSRTSIDSDADPVRLDHQQFEEEEEELEDIWNHTTNYRQSICSDIMYQPSQEEPRPPDQVKEPCPRSPSPQAPAVLYRNQTTASAPNLLVAEFKLPPYVQSLLGYDKENSPKGHQPALTVGERRSWAAFPNREPTSKTSLTVNETASDLVKLPDAGDHRRYIYHYREEEEEEEDREDAEQKRVGEEVAEHTNYSKEESVSVLSVSGNLISLEKQEGVLAAGGRPVASSGKPELQSMEGTLERKQKLQLGGKKAASRGWNSYHTILYRHTLGFYEDRKDTLRNSAGGLPLNLTGAECSPAPDYTKRPNCFRLSLRDGSEYVLSAPSRFLMRKWIMKIQANTGPNNATPSAPVDLDFPTSLKPSLCSTCHSLAKCLCSRQAGPGSTPPKSRQSGSGHPKEIIVLNREMAHTPQGHLNRVDEQAPVTSLHGGCCDGDGDALNQRMSHRLFGTRDASPSPDFPVSSDLEWLGKKHRSHSFTSATFQKIKPAFHTSAGRGLEKGSNYCVTLVVGDKSSDGPSGSRSSDPPLLASAGWQQDTSQDSDLRSYTSLPRPRDKSIFKKFFGKRDL